MNLLNETRIAISKSGHTSSDIIFIGSEMSGHQCTWQQYQELANIEYDAGYGAQIVASDLIIVFADGGKMWRNVYAGSEWWEYSTPFEEPQGNKTITTLTGCSGMSLAYINE